MPACRFCLMDSCCVLSCLAFPFITISPLPSLLPPHTPTPSSPYVQVKQSQGGQTVLRKPGQAAAKSAAKQQSKRNQAFNRVGVFVVCC